MQLPNVLMIGTGEYTTGYVHGAAAESDKSAGVIALCFFELRRQGRVGNLLMAGTSGHKFPGVRKHLQGIIADRYQDLSVEFESFPRDDIVSDPTAYKTALERLSPGDIVTVFTPDDTHFAIALDSIRRGCHVLIAKPIVKTVAEHQQLIEAAKETGSLVAMEVHKRWDPMYVDACDRIRSLGDFSFFASYMSQPKAQLDTFSKWAGKSSDISYYLNAHHVDFNYWAVAHLARPHRVFASAADGHATGRGIPTEDTITLTVDWRHLTSNRRATGVYTASWIAPLSDVHSQQRFFYLGDRGEVQIDQAHRGYSVSTDEDGYLSANPLFMKYTPDASGYFAGQSGYGFRSIEAFLEAAVAIRHGEATAADFSSKLATLDETLPVTAILEAGRRSLDEKSRPVSIQYNRDGLVVDVE